MNLKIGARTYLPVRFTQRHTQHDIYPPNNVIVPNYRTTKWWTGLAGGRL